jgi:hypothetical protein
VAGAENADACLPGKEGRMIYERDHGAIDQPNTKQQPGEPATTPQVLTHEEKRQEMTFKVIFYVTRTINLFGQFPPLPLYPAC